MYLLYLAIAILIFSVMSFDWVTSPAFGEDTPPTRTPTTASPSPSTDPNKNPSTVSDDQGDRKAQKELETVRSNPNEFRTLVLGVQIFLGRFGYGVGPYSGTLNDQTKEALRKYQEHAHLSITGDIDFHTLKHLTEDNKALDEVIPVLPNAQVHQSSSQKVVHTKGSWARNDQSETLRLFQTSLITCDKDRAQCVESTAFLNTGTGTTPTLSVDHLWYEVKSWTDQEIVTNPLDVDPCSVAILRVNIEQQSSSRFLSVQQNEELCKQKISGDFFYRLVNGQPIFLTGKQRKAQHIQKILRVDRPVD